MPHPHDKSDRTRQTFTGFTPLDANFVYCPNQFLDLCLPFHSRGCVRLVAFLIRKTLGWRDELGRPRQQRVPVPYQVLIDQAGISRGAIRDAIDEAVKARLIRCTLQGNAHCVGKAARSSSYELHWDHGTAFARSPTEFNGFFAGEGHRTPIPNDFFDVVIPHEPLAVTRVVGAIIRKTIGYQDQFGGRRMAAPLSFTELQRRSNIADRKTIAGAIRRAIDARFIVLVRAGRFDPNGGEKNQSAAYGIKWSSDATSPVSSKSPPVQSPQSVQLPHRYDAAQLHAFQPEQAHQLGSESPPTLNPTAPSVQKTLRTRSKKPTHISSKIQPLKKAKQKDTSKEQQQPDAAAVLLKKLQQAGFELKAAQAIVAKTDGDVIERQLRWIDCRSASRNRLGMLRKAIEEDWEEPVGAATPNNLTGATATTSTGTPRDTLTDKQDYLDYVERLQDQLALQKPDDFALFSRWRERERERLGRGKSQASGVLAWFDSRPKYLEDLARFFDTDIEPFEKWRRHSTAVRPNRSS